MVTPYAGVWIEIARINSVFSFNVVTPYAGVWIEMRNSFLTYQQGIYVTPYAGVWIEIQMCKEEKIMIFVTPYAGVWIEILVTSVVFANITSLPTRECGLKYTQITEKRLIC